MAKKPKKQQHSPNDITKVLKKAAGQRSPAEKALIKARKAGVDTNSGSSNYRGATGTPGVSRLAGSGIGGAGTGRNQITVDGKVFNPKHLGGLARTESVRKAGGLAKWAKANKSLASGLNLSNDVLASAQVVFRARDKKVAARKRKKGQ